MKFSEKNVLMITLKFRQNQGFATSVKNTTQKTIGGVEIGPPSSSYFRFKLDIFYITNPELPFGETARKFMDHFLVFLKLILKFTETPLHEHYLKNSRLPGP